MKSGCRSGAWLLILICAVLCLFSCGQKGTAPGSSGDASRSEDSEIGTEPAEPSAGGLELVRNGMAKVTVVYPQYLPDAKKCAVTLTEELTGITAASPVLQDDFLREGEQHDPDTVEILVGYTNYAESVQVMSRLSYGDYAVEVIGNKVVVAAAYTAALEQAVYELGRIFRNHYHAETNSVILPTETALQGNAAGENLREIPQMGEGIHAPAIVSCGNDTYMLYVSGATDGNYTDYCATLRQAGFEQLRTSAKGSNRYATYAKGNVCVEVNYYPANREMRCIVLPENVYVAGSEYDLTKVFSGTAVPLLTQVGLNYTQVINGMSYVLRTQENTFIVIDGGMGGQGEETAIYNLMVEQSGMETPVIAAWILTHPHNDHIGAISDFITRYGGRIVPERIIFNFADDKILGTAGNDCDGKSYGVIKRALSGKWKDCRVIKPHTGQKLLIDGVEIEILHTAEEVYPDTDAMLRNNANSMTFTMKTAGRSILITGDISSTYGTEMIGWYGNELKCDILQVIHHARTHGSIAFYKAAAPTIALWPTSRTSDEEYGSRDYNAWLRDNVPHNVYCYNGTATVNLLTMEIRQ